MPEFERFEGPLDGDTEGSFIPFQGQLDQPQPAKQRGWREELTRQLGLTARAGITGLTGVGSAIADFGTGAANLMGAGLPIPSQEMQKSLTRMGLPSPETPTEHAAGFGASVLAGGMDPASVALTRAISAAKSLGGENPLIKEMRSAAQRAAKSGVIKELRDEGYKLPPTEMGGGALSRTAEGLGGSARTAQLAQVKNQEVTQDLARRALKLPEGTQLTAEVLQNQADDLIRSGYDPIRNLPRIGIGKAYRNDLGKIASEFGGSASFPEATRNQVRELVRRYSEDATGRPLQQYTGFDALQEIKLLRREAGANFKPGGDALLGEAQRRIAKALEDNIELNLKAAGPSTVKNYTPKLLTNFQEARKALAKNFAVERMLVDPDTGIVSTAKAQQLLRSGTPLTDELATIAKAGSPAFSRATNAPLRGVPPAANFGDNVLYMGGLANFANPGVLLAGLPTARAGARQAVLSEPVQRSLMRNLAGQGGFFSTPPGQRTLAATPFPLFSQGEQ